MKKTNYLIFLVILFIPIVHAYDLTVPHYLDVNETETITITSTTNEYNNTAKMYLNDSTILNFTKTDNYTYSLSIINTQEQDYIYNISILDNLNNSLQNYTGTLKFRIPYYVTFDLYEAQNQTFTTNFNYIYLREVKPKTYTQIGTDLGGLLKPTVKPDYTETFWGKVTSNSATIKLYNEGTFYITLQTMKTFNPTAWNYEFYKPQYTKSLSETNIESGLTITEKINTTYNILLSDYELNKPNSLLKQVKWFFWIIVLIVGLVGAVYSGQPLAFFSVPIVWLITTLIFTFVGWL